MNDWFIYALFTPLLFAIVNIADDNLVRRVYKSPEFGVITSGLFALLPLLSIPFLPLTIPHAQIIFLALLAGFLTILYYLFYFKALLIESPSVVIALFSLSRAIIPFLAYFFLGELLTLYQYVGFFIILCASIGISVVDIKKFYLPKSFYYILFASIFTASIAILDKIVYKNVDFRSGYMFFCMGMGFGAFSFLLLTREGRKYPRQFISQFKKFIILFIITEIFGIAAEFMLGLAISKGPVTLVKIMESTQPLFVLFIALFLYPFFPSSFREATYGKIKKKISFVLVMLLGIILIYSFR